MPTAQILVFDTTVIAFRTSLLPAGPGLGDVTSAHFVPFQCSASVCFTPPDVRYPTAQALQPDTTPTP